jgi:hypothetical protein
MSNIKFWDVYDGGRQEHLTSVQALSHVHLWEAGGPVIADDVAQTIASWWCSPARPYTTRLSTMGRVDRYLTLDDFATETERPQYDVPGQAALRALGAYIDAKQAAATMGPKAGYRPCACDDCPDLTIGANGELCDACQSAGCSATEHAACERDDAYLGEGECPACGNPLDYCPGHGAVGDPAGHRVLEMHEKGDHSRCITASGACD